MLVDSAGVRTLVASATPQRVRRGDGTWSAIDPTLRRVGGGVVPAATLADVSFSAGGSGPMVTWRSGAATFTLGAPSGGLPAPRLAGATAVYESVLPGVNLHVTATAEGFTHAVEVLTPAAAANPAVRRLRYPTGGNVRVDRLADGGIRLVDAAGATLGVTRAASMWDSTRESERAGEVLPGVAPAAPAEPASAAEPGVASRQAEVAVDVVDGGLVVRGDERMLADPAVTWPVFIDPPFNGLRSKWAYANNANKNWDVGNRAWVGRNPYDGVLYRSFFDFDTSAIRGTQVLSAKVTMKLDHSYSCDNDWVHLYRTATAGITSASGGRMAWATRPLPSSTWLDSWEGHANEAGGCGQTQPDADAVFERAELTADVQAQATANATTYTVGLCACNPAGEYESSQGRWKKFFTDRTYLIATYDKSPNVPTVTPFSTTTDCYRACVSPARVRTATPTLGVGVSDPYNGNLRTTFEVRTAASETASLVAGNAAAPVTTSAPGPATWRVPSGVLTNGTSYYWRAWSVDENNLTGQPTGWQTLTVDTAAPAAPTVSSGQYPEQRWGAVLGTAGTFQLGGASDVAEFAWRIDSGPTTTVAATAGTTTTATASATPGTDMVHTLAVTARDTAGNTSPTRSYQFWVSPVPNKYAHWSMDEVSGVTAADTGGGGSARSPMTASGGVSFGPGYLGNAASFTGGGSQLAAAGPVLDTTRSFTVMAWVRASDLTTSQVATVLSQDGTTAGRFTLGYRRSANGGAGGWCFAMRTTEAGTPTTACTNGSSWGLPSTGTWMHLAGVYDTSTGTIRAYVMGDPLSCGGEVAETAFTGSWAATGSFVIGRSRNPDATTDHWRGAVDDVYAFQRVLSAAEICQRAVE
ncbi:LamG-like jellyroll fold domain-containing protein [Plantactinospora sp. B6F1]|uniref:LamG-like jellyroll fold domain-containing protein n=1 Tax=Plantactinospora sp. B6F1 TaxID=3158971 RepID=UPI0032D91717